MQPRATPYVPAPARSAPTLPGSASSWIAEIPWDVRILAKICQRFAGVMHALQDSQAAMQSIIDRGRTITEQLDAEGADVDALMLALDGLRREQADQTLRQADAMDAHVMACCYAILYTWADPLWVLDARAALDDFDTDDPTTHVYSMRADPIGDMCSDTYTDLLALGVTTDEIRAIGGRIVEACATARCGGLSQEAAKKADFFPLLRGGSPT